VHVAHRSESLMKFQPLWWHSRINVISEVSRFLYIIFNIFCLIYYLYDLREPNFFFNFKLNSWQPNFSLMWLKFPYEKSFSTRITNSGKFDLFLPPDSRAPLTGYINEMKIGIIFDRIILIDRSDRNAGGISLNISQFQKKRRKYVCIISFKFPLSYIARADRAYRNAQLTSFSMG